MLTQLILNSSQHLRRQGVSTAGKPREKPIISYSPFPNSSDCLPGCFARCQGTDWQDSGAGWALAGLPHSQPHCQPTAFCQTGNLWVPADLEDGANPTEVSSLSLSLSLWVLQIIGQNQAIPHESRWLIPAQQWVCLPTDPSVSHETVPGSPSHRRPSAYTCRHLGR